MDVNGQPYASAAVLPGKEPRVAIEKEAGVGPRTSLDVLENRRNSHPYRIASHNLLVLQPVAESRCISRYTAWSSSVNIDVAYGSADAELYGGLLYE